MGINNDIDFFSRKNIFDLQTDLICMNNFNKTTKASKINNVTWNTRLLESYCF